VVCLATVPASVLTDCSVSLAPFLGVMLDRDMIELTCSCVVVLRQLCDIRRSLPRAALATLATDH